MLTWQHIISPEVNSETIIEEADAVDKNIKERCIRPTAIGCFTCCIRVSTTDE